MGSRRRAREVALQALYALDLNPGLTVEQALAHVEQDRAAEPLDGPSLGFATRIVRGVVEARQTIDDAIAAASTRWRIDRMAAVDRNVLRMATYELLFEPDIPVQVILDEAVEIVKRFGTEGSSAFVNGVLHPVADRVRK